MEGGRREEEGGRREGRREGGREEGMEGGREESGREGGRDGWRDVSGREGGRKGGGRPTCAQMAIRMAVVPPAATAIIIFTAITAGIP